MAPLPTACSACRQPFAMGDPRRRLVSLEGKLALCSECEWRTTHPEAPKYGRTLAAYSNITPTWIATAPIGLASN